MSIRSSLRRKGRRAIDALGYLFGVLLTLNLAISAIVADTALGHALSAVGALVLAVMLLTMARRQLR